MTNPLRHCQTAETAEIVDKLLGDFLLSCIGKNDMAVANGFLTSAAILLATHCQRTGDDYEEMSALLLRHFSLALNIAGERV